MKTQLDSLENDRYDFKGDIKYLLLVGIPSGVLIYFLLKCANFSMLF